MFNNILLDYNYSRGQLQPLYKLIGSSSIIIIIYLLIIFCINGKNVQSNQSFEMNVVQ